MDKQAANRDVDRLVEEYRVRCLWFLRPDYYPSTLEERLKVLGYIEQRGDLEGFRRAATLRQWFLLDRNATSADS